MITVGQLLFKEEVEKYLNYVINGEEISIIDGYGTKITMVNENSIKERLNEFIDFFDKEIDRQFERESLNMRNSISKCSYAHAYGKVKASLINIVNGRWYDEYKI